MTEPRELNDFGTCDGDVRRMNTYFFEGAKRQEIDFWAGLNLTKKKRKIRQKKTSVPPTQALGSEWRQFYDVDPDQEPPAPHPPPRTPRKPPSSQTE